LSTSHSCSHVEVFSSGLWSCCISSHSLARCECGSKKVAEPMFSGIGTIRDWAASVKPVTLLHCWWPNLGKANVLSSGPLGSIRRAVPELHREIDWSVHNQMINSYIFYFVRQLDHMTTTGFIYRGFQLLRNSRLRIPVSLCYIVLIRVIRPTCIPPPFPRYVRSYSW
jgi:hypothetical protein